MTRTSANIAQIELSHVGGTETASLDELFDEMQDRIKDDMVGTDFDRPTAIKTCFRIYDSDGTMTRYVRDLMAMPSFGDDLARYQAARSWFGRWRAHHGERRNTKRRATLKQRMAVDAGNLVRRAIGNYDPVAIEGAEHTFRMMRREEASEMWSRATHYSHVWLFVFAPNDLLADDNQLIGSIALEL